MTLYLSRARLKRTPSIAAIGKVLLPDHPTERANAAHHLIWSLFAGDPEQQRNFLWRDDQGGHFYILSATPPGQSEIFDTDTKHYTPELQPGDMLQFILRAYATKSLRMTEKGKRGTRTDVVMAALHELPKEDRASRRDEITSTAGNAWLATQGTAHGFDLPKPVQVEGGQRPGSSNARAKIRPLDFSGQLVVTEPEKFMAQLSAGFGRARAFGCGLMLIRRA
jgi:CRISPR system Cascade subunit CasE